LLIEDYADEWLWRPAMHYRWSYRLSRVYAAEALYEGLIKGNKPIPRFIALNILKARQYGGFVRGDGVNRKTRFHADRTYLTALDRLQAIFQIRPFIMGASPTIADFGLMGPMLRHFGQDPTPAEIMRNRAPAVYEWVARLWNAKDNDFDWDLLVKPDETLVELLTEICETNLAQHRQNAQAFTQGRNRFDMKIQDCQYRRVPTSRYRVWCLEALRREWAALDTHTQEKVKISLLPDASVLWDDTEIKPSGYDIEEQAPFNRAINVYKKGFPGF
jgi:hypothetical protein